MFGFSSSEFTYEGKDLSCESQEEIQRICAKAVREAQKAGRWTKDPYFMIESKVESTRESMKQEIMQLLAGDWTAIVHEADGSVWFVLPNAAVIGIAPER